MGFYETFTYTMSINRGRIIINQGFYASLVEIYSFLLFSLLVKSIELEIQLSSDRVDTSRV